MCAVISSGPCTCTSSGPTIPTLFKVAWKLAFWSTAALAAFLWWLTGPAVLPRARRHGRKYARRVHAAGRIALTAVTVAALAWPLTTGIALLGLGVGLAVTATVIRDRRRRAAQLDPASPRPAIRTRVTIRRPAAQVSRGYRKAGAA